MTKESEESSAESKERVGNIGLTGKYKCKILRCLREYGASYVGPEDEGQTKDGWLTQNQVVKWLREQGLLGDDVQVSSVNPQFAQLMASGHVVQMAKISGVKHAHQRRDPDTGGWGTLWKIAPPGTEPTVRCDRQFFLVNSVTKITKGPYTREEATAEMQNRGKETNWFVLKASGSKRRRLEFEHLG